MLIPLEPDLPQILSFSAMGFCVVMVVLAFLSAITSCVGKCFTSAEKLKAAAQKKNSAKPAKKAGSGDIPAEHAMAISAAVASVLPELEGEKAELVAVLAAAATVALEQECAVISYKRVDLNYARYGREQIFSAQNYTPLKNK